jgi:hypothetical protein
MTQFAIDDLSARAIVFGAHPLASRAREHRQLRYRVRRSTRGRRAWARASNFRNFDTQRIPVLQPRSVDAGGNAEGRSSVSDRGTRASARSGGVACRRDGGRAKCRGPRRISSALLSYPLPAHRFPDSEPESLANSHHPQALHAVPPSRPHHGSALRRAAAPAGRAQTDRKSIQTNLERHASEG